MAANRWMAKVLVLMFAAVSVEGFMDGCINTDHCRCVDDSVICNCKRGGHLNLLGFMISKNLNVLHINGCEAVAFNPMTFSEHYPKVLLVTDVEELFIRPMAFHNIGQHMSEISIARTVIKSLDPHAFLSVHGLSRLTLDNVTIGNLSTLAFEDVGDIGELVISSSSIDMVATGAFNRTTNVGRVLIRQCVFGSFEPHAFVFVNVSSFLLEDCDVEHWKNHSVSLVNVSEATISRCSVGVLEDHAVVALATDNITFSGCSIAKTLPDALEALRDSSHVVLWRNRFEDLAEGSLFPSTLSVNASWDMADNLLPCNSDLCWLFDYKVPGRFFLDNFCSSTNDSLSEFASRLDDEDVCIEISSGHEDTVTVPTMATVHTGTATTTASTTTLALSCALLLPLLVL